MVWINRPTATGKKKSNFMWYFVEPTHFRFLRRKKFSDEKSAKQGVSYSVKPFVTYVL